MSQPQGKSKSSSLVQRIEIQFDELIEISEDAYGKLVDVATQICKEYQATHPGRTMWPMHFGSKFLKDPLSLGDNEAIPCDDSVSFIGCYEREDYDWKCAKCGLKQMDHKHCSWPNPKAGNCNFEPRSS